MKWKKGDGSYVVFGGSTVFLSLAQSGLHMHLKTSCCGLGTFIQQLNEYFSILKNNECSVSV